MKSTKWQTKYWHLYVQMTCVPFMCNNIYTILISTRIITTINNYYYKNVSSTKFSIKISIYFFQRNIESVLWYITGYLNKIIQCQKHGKVIILLSTISSKVISKLCVRVSNFISIGVFFMGVSTQCFAEVLVFTIFQTRIHNYD